jgi:hypothetical protein
MTLVVPKLHKDSADDGFGLDFESDLVYAIQSLSEAIGMVQHLDPTHAGRCYPSHDDFHAALVQHRSRIDRLLSVQDEIRAIQDGLGRPYGGREADDAGE